MNQRQNSRRGHHEGGITTRRNHDGKVTGYQVQVRLPDGSRPSKTVRTKTEANTWVREQWNKYGRGEHVTATKQLTIQYLYSWLAIQQGHVRSSTYAAYKLNVNRLMPHIRQTKLAELKTLEVQKWYNALANQGLHPQTLRQIHRTLHKALEDAIKLNIITRNASDGTSLPRIPTKEMNWYTPAQLSEIFQATNGQQFHALWVILATTGLRLGEALGLKWADIDLEKRTLTVHRALQRDRAGGGLLLVEPKSARSRRTLQLSSHALRALRNHQHQQTYAAQGAPEAWHDHNLVFCTGFGTPLDQGRIQRHWHKAIEQAGVPRYRIHDLRHSVATNLLMEGMHPRQVADILGHSSPSLVLEVYGHVVPST